MRRIVVAVFAFVLVLIVAGCGGGGAQTQNQPATTTATAGAAGAAGSSTTNLPEIGDRSANESSTFVAFPTGENVPPDLMYKVTVEKQPTLIYFYDSTQQASKEVRTSIDEVRADNRGLVDLVAYDIGRYLRVKEDGSVEVDASFAENPHAKSAIQLARDPVINVSFTPFIVLTDGQGYIIYKHRGLIDRKFLEREVLRAAR
jgi:hypothetical protein